MDSVPTEAVAVVGDRCTRCERAIDAGLTVFTDGYDAVACSPLCYSELVDNYDPSPWCSGCGAGSSATCDCGPIAEND